MSALVIEKGIPVPTGPTGSKWPFRQMEVGDSFLTNKDRNLVAASASAFGRRNPGYKFITRKEAGGIRVWRIAADTKGGTQP